ncbi:MAG: IS66 family insertion sequence element accessory protein TnpA [Methyloceanibacter sp.]
MGHRRQESAAYWRGILERQIESGLSVAGFCRQEAVSAPSFYAWRRKLQEPDRAAREAPRNTATAVSTRLLPVRIAAGAATTSVRVFLPQGVSIDAPSSIDPSALAALVGALREARGC